MIVGIRRRMQVAGPADHVQLAGKPKPDGASALSQYVDVDATTARQQEVDLPTHR
jgi:hypothetical protein